MEIKDDYSFPRDPELRESWIVATGRAEGWLPSKSSTVCSQHFEESHFQLTRKSRRLFPWAVPSLRLELVFKEELKEASEKLARRKSTITITDNTSGTPEINQIIILTNEPPPSHGATKPKDNVKILLERKSNMIRQQKYKIKLLQGALRRYKKKCLKMNSIIKELRKSSLINEHYYSAKSAKHTAYEINDLVDTSLTALNA